MKSSVNIIIFILMLLSLFPGCAANNKMDTNEDLDKKMTEIKRIGDKKEVKALKYLINEFENSSSDAVRIEVVRAFGKIGDARAIPILKKALEEEKKQNIMREIEHALILIDKAKPPEHK